MLHLAKETIFSRGFFAWCRKLIVETYTLLCKVSECTVALNNGLFRKGSTNFCSLRSVYAMCVSRKRLVQYTVRPFWTLCTFQKVSQNGDASRKRQISSAAADIDRPLGSLRERRQHRSYRRVDLLRITRRYSNNAAHNG